MEGWAAKKPRERAEVLRKAFELIIRDTERFAKLMTIENGKALADSRAEVAYAAEFFRWYAEEAVRNIGEVSRAPASGARIFVQHKPAGVAVLVTPWNFPAAMATRKIGPALAAGCAVVLKPASETPLTMLALMPVMEEAGVPAGVINVLPSRRSGPVVDAMLKDPRCVSSRSPARPRSGASSCTPPPTMWSSRRWSSAATRRSSCSRTRMSTRRSTAP
jgi:NAD-dependent aldehyde dehydrogenases